MKAKDINVDLPYLYQFDVDLNLFLEQQLEEWAAASCTTDIPQEVLRNHPFAGNIVIAKAELEILDILKESVQAQINHYEKLMNS